MKRLNLGQQLALILAVAMIASLLAIVSIDRINTIHHTKNDYLGSTDNLALTLLELHGELSRRDFETAVTLSQHPSNWIYFGPWDGLHPTDKRDEAWEQTIRRFEPWNAIPVDAVRVGNRTFDFAPVNPRVGAVRSAPQAVSIGNQPKQMLLAPPSDGSPRRWVLQPYMESSGTSIWPTPEYAPPLRDPIAVDVYTVALQPAGSDDWIVVYRMMRPPPLGGTLSITFYALLAGLVVSGIALLVGRRVMASFQRVAQQAELLGRGERAPEVPVEGPKDVREIVTAFNSMNARVGQATDYQIGLLHSLGHDLKGPLASVARLVGNVSPNETRTQIEHRLGRVQSIVDAIMSFSRAVMRDGKLEVIDLASLLAAIADEQADLGFNVTVETPARLLVTCRTNAMERCIRNLVENAVKHGGGSIRARLFADGDEAVVRIDDTGSGIPESEIESVFQPFFRLAVDEQGSGLGLAIARTIAIDHGGSLLLTNRPGGGLRVELKLPHSGA